MNNLGFFLIFLFFVKKCHNTNYFLPLKTINIYSNESAIKQDYLSKIYSSYLYTNFIIGSNDEEIKALINMSQVGFFIYENAYNYNSSSSFEKDLKSKNFYKRDYEEGYLANDTLCLLPYSNEKDLNKINIKKCNYFKKVNFSLLKSTQKNIENNLYENYGIIGLQQNEQVDEYTMPLFIKTLKNTDMINSHTFSFHFLNNTKSGENEGYILLGDEEFDEDNGKLKRTISQSKYGQVYWNLIFSEVIVGINNSFDTSYDNQLKNFETKDAQIIGDLPYIIGIKEYKNYINYNFFQDLLLQNICELKNVYIDEDYSTYVCNSKSDLFIEKYNNKFPKLYFRHHELNKTFILDQYDLFSYNIINKSDPNIYFLVFFSNKNEPYHNPEFPGGTIIKRWKLGIPFLKKYKLYFNADNRIITYYEKFNIDYNTNDNNNKEKDSKKSNTRSTLIKIIIIGGLFIIVFVLGILFHKNIIKLPRRKKANELDDEYEYTSNPNTLDEKKASLNNYEVSN
jgi:hypothetical protein